MSNHDQKFTFNKTHRLLAKYAITLLQNGFADFPGKQFLFAIVLLYRRAETRLPETLI